MRDQRTATSCRSSRRVCFIGSILFATSVATQGASWNVAKTGHDSSTCGTSAGNACLTIGFTINDRAHSGDTILIGPGTYPEALTLDKSLRLSGITPGVVTLNAMQLNTALVVNPKVTAEISHMTITGGFQGGDNTPFPVGGITNNGVLALYEVKVQGNSTAPSSSMPTPGYGGILNAGTLEIYASTISGNSVEGGCDNVGGIENFGYLFMDFSTVSNNSAGGAGSCSPGPGGIIGSTDGIFSLSNLVIDTSLISGNTIATNGGSLLITRSTLTKSNVALSLFQPATIVNSTISGNGDAIDLISGFYGYSGSAQLINTTVANNGSGVNGSGSSYVGIQNSILADNGADCGGGFLSGDYNIVGSDTNCPTLDPSENMIGISPSLGPLRYNGGPTPTMMPLPGSPAINAGSPVAAQTKVASHSPPISGYCRAPSPPEGLATLDRSKCSLTTLDVTKS